MRGRERERESGRRRKEAEDDRDEQRVTREREKEGGRFCRGSGCRFTNPLRPPPVRFPPFRFVSNLEWRFWPRAREEREERKGKWRSRRAQRPPPPPLFHSGLRGASWKRRNNVIDLPIENFSFEKIALLRFRDHFFLPARSFVVEGVDFFLSGVGLGWRPRGGDPSKGIQRDGVSEVEAGFN